MNIKDGSTFRGSLGPVCEIKQIAEDGEFDGYASVFGERDSGNDVMMPGAFMESLARYPAERVKLLWQHRPDEPLGRFLEMREDARGLYCRGRLNLKIGRAAEAHELMKDGAVDGLSIGYRTEKEDVDRALGVRRLVKVELREVSLVTFPMNESARVTRVKGAEMTEREFERWLMRDAGFTASEAKAIIANGFKSLANAREAGISEDGLAEDIKRLAQLLRG
jgi:HK97 family phage prohead protease